MNPSLTFSAVTTAVGVMLLTALLQTWRRSAAGSVRLLVVQGLALGGLVAALAASHGSVELVVVAVLVTLVKAGLIPWALGRTATGRLAERDTTARPAVGLLGAALLTTLAYAVSDPLRGGGQSVVARAIPAGIALVLIGFWILLTRHTAITQLVGLVVLDNGIAVVAFLTSDGLPLTVELGASLDVLLVVAILSALAARMRSTHGGTTLDELRELKD